MELEIKKNIVYRGANQRLSLVDVISPSQVGPWPAIIFMHGFKGFKDWGHWPMLMKRIASSGFHLISFNSTHNGGTVEEPVDFPDLKAFSENTYSKELFDLNRIIDLVFEDKLISPERIQKEELSLIGHSRGGGVCLLQSARDKRVSRLITWAALSDFEDRLPAQDAMVEWEKRKVHFIKNGRTQQNMPMKYEFVKDLFENRASLKIESAAKKLEKPYLIIHGTADQAVSIQSAKDLKNWSPKSSLEIIEGANHVFGGKHPFSGEISADAEMLLEKSISFLKS